MDKLKELIVNTLQMAGNDTVTSCEYWQQFKEDIKKLPGGKHTLTIGNTVIEFTKK